MKWRRPKLLVFPGQFDAKQLPAVDDYHLRGLTMRDLLELMSGYAPGTYARLATETELRRREGWVARWSLFFSLVAVLVSIVALIVRRAD